MNNNSQSFEEVWPHIDNEAADTVKQICKVIFEAGAASKQIELDLAVDIIEHAAQMSLAHRSNVELVCKAQYWLKRFKK